MADELTNVPLQYIPANPEVGYPSPERYVMVHRVPYIPRKGTVESAKSFLIVALTGILCVVGGGFGTWWFYTEQQRLTQQNRMPANGRLDAPESIRLKVGADPYRLSLETNSRFVFFQSLDQEVRTADIDGKSCWVILTALAKPGEKYRVQAIGSYGDIAMVRYVLVEIVDEDKPKQAMKAESKQ